MIADNKKKTFPKVDSKIPAKKDLKQHAGDKTCMTDKSPDISYEGITKNAGNELSGYYVQLFLLS